MRNSPKCHRCDIDLRRMKIGDNLMYYCKKCGSTTSVEPVYQISEGSHCTA